MVTVLITGASSGFGRLIALALARAGRRVFASMRDVAGRNQTAAESLRREAQDGGLNLEVVELDVTRDDSVHAAVSSVLERAGSLDALVSNAGVACAGHTETFTPDDARRVFDVNVIGSLRVVRAVLPAMRARRSGALVYVSSTLGREVTPFLSLYGASKFALESIAEGIAYETTPLGVDTVIVQPGTFPTTSILANLVAPSEPSRSLGYGPVAEMPAHLFGALGAMVQQGRAPDPQRVADAVTEALSERRGGGLRRVVVDPDGDQGAARVNALCETVQREKLAGLGLEALLTPRMG